LEWDALVNGRGIKEEVHVANGIGSDDSNSILHTAMYNNFTNHAKMIAVLVYYKLYLDFSSIFA
jgi:hypothetical protein